MSIEWTEGKAIYLQIVEHISGEIAAGNLKPGQKIKSVREYAIELNVNPNTVQRALHELEREGILRSHRNTGRFVTDSTKMIEKMRREQAEQAVCDFCSKMMELGYDLGAAEKFFHEKAGTLFLSQGKLIG